jgi:hypothetical protein
MAHAPLRLPRVPSPSKIEFNYLNRNLMETSIHPPTVVLTAILPKADSVASFVSSNE